MLGIIGAMKIEVESIKNLMENKSVEVFSGIEYVSGTLFGKPVVAAMCGVGKVAAAVCTQTMILVYKPDAIINTGTGGSLSSKLNIGDIAVAESLVQHDMDTSAIGDPKGMISGINIVNIPADEKISELMLEGVSTLDGVKGIKGVIASGDKFVADDALKAEIRDFFNAVVCEMEGAAIGHVCYLNKVPFTVIRAVSDCADGSSHMDYWDFLPVAAENASKLIEYFVKNY